jgi:formyltetrahydrofolate deformylase
MHGTHGLPGSFILTLSCQDRVGIVASVSSYLASVDGFIVDSQQYADLETGSSSCG